MKRLLMVLPMVALAFAGFTPAHADDNVYPTDDTPIVVQCKGTAVESNNTGDFEFTDDRVNVGFISANLCAAWAPDTAEPLPSEPPAEPSDIGRLRGSTPVGVMALHDPVKLRANGNYACGNGTLSSADARRGSEVRYWQGTTQPRTWIVEWDATFSNGIGEIGGTATLGEDVRTVSGTMVVSSNSLECDHSGADAVLTLILE